MRLRGHPNAVMETSSTRDSDIHPVALILFRLGPLLFCLWVKNRAPFLRMIESRGERSMEKQLVLSFSK